MKPPKKYTQTIKKAFLGILLSVFLLVSNAQPALAQFATTSPDVLGFEGAQIVREEAQKNIGKALVGALTAVLINGLNYVSTLTAQSTAQWIADGGSGRHPLFNRQTIQEIGESVEAYVTSEFIDEIAPGSKVLASLGIDPNNPDATSFLRRALANPYMNQPERLDGTIIAQGFNGYIASVASLPGDSADRQAKIITDTINAVNVNEFYGLMQAYGQTRARAGGTAALEEFRNTINAGFQDLTDPISGAVRWPAQQVRQQLDSAIAAKKQNDVETGRGLIAAAGENALIQVGINFVTTFTSTLFGSLTQKLFDGLLADIDPVTFNPFDPNQITSSRNDNLFESIGIFQTLDPSNFNLIQELASCPATLVRNSRGIFSCAIDSNFLSAVAQGNSGAPLTLEQAIEEGFINENWVLFGPNASENKDASCHQRAFCYTNLQKLRKARIIPIGWELAAELSGSGEITLGEIMNGFYDCNSDGQRDDAHPYCNLINPQWIIKAPESQCRTLAYGQQLEASGVENRAQECVDVQTCVAEDENGNCIGQFGYCLAEENIWRFRGDSCDPQYASCQTLINASGTQVSYNLNTVDYAECGPDSSGCAWYATEKTADEEGNFDWPEVNDVSTFVESADASNEISYFKGTVEDCSATDAGCTNVRSRANGLSFNMIQNPGFDSDSDSNDFPDYWSLTGSASYADSIFGGRGINPGNSRVSQYGLTLKPNLDYVFSYDFGSGDFGGVVQSSIRVSLLIDGTPVNVSSVFGDGTRLVPLGGTTCEASIQNGSAFINVIPDIQGNFGCIFNLPSVASLDAVYVAEITFGGSGIFDNVMLEQSSNASFFAEGYTSGASVESIQLPPDYLNCRGAEDDPEECANYAQICSALDAGCTLYTPLGGGPDISAIIGEGDLCPGVCIGYDAYKQEPTKYEPQGVFPLHFIPRTAQTCSIEASGCSEFTDLQTEEVKYFTDLRACNTPTQAGDNAQTFYTWQGSEDEGFQLRAWNLLESNTVENAPCISFEASASGNTCTDPGPAEINTNEACNERSDIFTNPDCREFFNADGEIHYREWSKTISINDACTTYRKTSVVGNDATERASVCRGSGGYSDSSGSCLYFGLESESETCSASENGCRLYTGGRSNNSLTLLEETFESGLNLWAGNSPSQVSLSSESLSEGGQSLSLNNTTSWVYFGELDAPAGNSPITAPQANLAGDNCTISPGSQYCGPLAGQLVPGTTYTLSFWARGTGRVRAGFAKFDEGDFDEEFDLFTNEYQSLGTEWRRYEFGPINIEDETFGPQNSLFFDADGSVFLDNIVLIAGEQNLALIQNSWVTPASCDTDSQGQFSPQFHLGCQAYANSSGGTNFLKSFSRLCSEDQVGCTGYFDGQSSESPYGLTAQGICNRLDSNLSTRVTCHLEQNTGGVTFNQASPRLCIIAPGESSCTFTFDQYIEPLSNPLLSHIEINSDTERVETDQPVYAIVDQSDFCNPANLGCTEFGLPTLSADQSTVENWSSVYLIDNPDAYANILCQEDELFCSEFRTPNQQSVYYFRDPGQKVCEYKDSVRINGQVYSGWFVKGTSDFCYGTGTCRDSAGTSCTTDSDCRQPDAGTCSVSGNACSQDSDCSTNESCLGTSDDICQIDNGSYIISGIESGIRLNGDASYAGWVAECPPGQSGCRGFEDPLDSAEQNGVYGNGDSETYYYIDNGNIGDRNLTRTQACNGEYSTEEGCILFNDTAIPERNFNASASNIASKYADRLDLGDRPFDLVQPLDCTPGNSLITYVNESGQRETIDLCSNRCQYRNNQLKDRTEICVAFSADGACLESFDPSSYTSDPEDFLIDINVIQNEFRNANGTDGITYPDLSEISYTLGGSCFVDADCAPLKSDSGSIVNGTCGSEVLVGGFGPTNNSIIESVPVRRLENDSNRVIKVNRDRTCSEWASLDDCRVIWDPNLGQFRNSCAGLQLCAEHDPTGARTCKVPVIGDPAFVLDIDYYTSRDTSWYGKDYSGYAIPNQFLASQLSQEDISPDGVCYIGDQPVYFAGQLKSCRPNAQGGGSNTGCNASLREECKPVLAEDTVYTLAFNAGSCQQGQTGFGETCTVGFCSGDGNPCSENDQCLNGVCTIGQCVNRGRSCSQDSDCGSFGTCNAGICESPTGEFCRLDGSCGVGTCNISSLARAGTCFSGNCLLAVDGSPLRTIDSEVKACRAQPESDSPFSNEIVEAWSALIDDSQNGNYDLLNTNQTTALDPNTSPQAVPFNVRSGFERVNTCAPGEVCECSYKKLTSASGSNYIEISSTSEEILRQVLRMEEGESVRGYSLGICSGGVVDGAFCAIDRNNKEYGCRSEVYDPQNPDASGGLGTCNPIQREDTLLGLKGFCLERDTGVNVNGDPEAGACLTWYPVDELAGETDFYAKFKSAGFFEDTYQCTEIVNNYAFPPFFGCATERGVPGDWKNDTGSRIVGNQNGACAYMAHCPEGFYAIAGNAEGGSDNATSTYTEMCASNVLQGTRVACPYICVAKNAVDSDGELCEPPETGRDSDFTKRQAYYKVANIDDIVDDSGSPEDDEDDDGVEIASDGWSTRNDVFYTDDIGLFASTVEDYSECVGYGFDVDGADTGIHPLVSSRTNANNDPNYFPFVGNANLKGQTGGTAILCGWLNLLTAGSIQSQCAAIISGGTISFNGVLDFAEFPAPATTTGNSNSAGSDYVVRGSLGPDGLLTGNPVLYPACQWLLKTSDSDPRSLIAPKTNFLRGFGLEQLYSETNNLQSGSKTVGSQVFNYSVNNLTRFITTPVKPFGASLSPFASPFADNMAYPIPHCYHDLTYLDGQITGSGQSNVTRYLKVYTNATVSEDGTLECPDLNDDQVNLIEGKNTARNITYLNKRLVSLGSNPVYAMNWLPFYRRATDPANTFLFAGDSASTTSTQIDISAQRTISALISNIFAIGGTSSVFPPGIRSIPDSQAVEFSWSVEEDGYRSLPGSPINLAWDSRAEGNPPAVYSINYNSPDCVGGLCPEGPRNTISLNGRNSGDFVAEDGFFQATLEFYAMADPNQLPLRRIIVDWSNVEGDRRYTGSNAVDNFYKNHRGVNNRGDVICQQNDEWGKTAESCEASPLRYTKSFVCNRLVWTQLEACAPGQEYPCSVGEGTADFADDYCVFQPAVHIRDQWGWCTGTCTGDGGTRADGDGCFTPESLDMSFTTPDTKNECNYLEFPDFEGNDTRNDPWVRYDGEIRVRAR